MPKIRVLIVDDAVVVRKILTDTLSTDPDIEVSTAANGKIALQKIPQVNPDVVTLDVEMPEMDGLETLREIRKTYPKLPVIMFSTLTGRGAATTLDALSAGASDYATKPANVGKVGEAMARVREEMIPKIRALCGRDAGAAPSAGVGGGSGAATLAAPAAAPRPKPPIAPAVRPGTRAGIDVVAIGVSTGGPNALSVVLPGLAKDLPVPVVLVQHMPPVFTKLLAERLDTQCGVRVVEGAAGMRLQAGHVYIAPGGQHMVVEREGGVLKLALNMEPPENSCRPAVD
ncbi:MAG: chemotaxis protein CheB, partial [Phycisphaerales bacterium]